MDRQTADILVAGAGPAGATVARLLALRGCRVVLVDPGTRPIDRLEIVSPSTGPVFAALGLMRLLGDPAIARPCLGIRRRWGTADIEIDDFFRRPGGQGFVIDRTEFDLALGAMAREAGVEFVAGRLVAARREVDALTAKIETETGVRMLSARLLIDATGRPAAVARRLGAGRMVTDTLVAERHAVERNTAAQTPTWLDVNGGLNGWSYQMCGPDGRREMWNVQRPAQRQPGRAHARVDASSAILSRAAGSGWIAVGDAAASFDPVTSQGLANALSTALVAAGAILTPRGLDDEAQRVYSDAVAATFRHSEVGRAGVYDALQPARRVAAA